MFEDDLGIPIHPWNIEQYSVPEVVPPLHPDDAALVEVRGLCVCVCVLRLSGDVCVCVCVCGRVAGRQPAAAAGLAGAPAAAAAAAASLPSPACPSTLRQPVPPPVLATATPACRHSCGHHPIFAAPPRPQSDEEAEPKKARLRGDAAELSWLLRTKYIAAEAGLKRGTGAPAKAAAAAATAAAAGAENEDPREERIRQIEAQFVGAKAPLAHGKDPSVVPLEVMPGGAPPGPESASPVRPGKRRAAFVGLPQPSAGAWPSALPAIACLRRDHFGGRDVPASLGVASPPCPVPSAPTALLPAHLWGRHLHCPTSSSSPAYTRGHRCLPTSAAAPCCRSLPRLADGGPLLRVGHL